MGCRLPTFGNPAQEIERSVMTPCAELPGATRDPTVSVLAVGRLVELVERLGIPRDELLRAAQLDAALLDDTAARLPRSEIYQLCEVALELTGDPALGLHWSERLTGTTFAPVSHLIAHSMNLRQGFESLSRFERLLSDAPSFGLHEQNGKLTVLCVGLETASLSVQRFVAEMTIGGFLRVVRAFREGAGPELVSFAYAAPSYRDEYVRVFGEAARFDQPFTGIVFENALLDAVSPNKDEDLHDALWTLAERRLARLTQDVPFALRVRDLLVERGWPGPIDMEIVARALGLSVRSLRRRLAAEGKSYSAIENEAFSIVAKRLLRDEQRTIQETAYEMGFSDPTTFHRAFKRATGVTPSTYQGKQRA